jgi:kynureninase
LEHFVDAEQASVITPFDPARHGAQLSVRLHHVSADVAADRLRERGVLADERQPDVVRLAAAPLYVTFHDCWRAATAIAAATSQP